jgi:hypothetical protein
MTGKTRETVTEIRKTVQYSTADKCSRKNDITYNQMTNSHGFSRKTKLKRKKSSEASSNYENSFQDGAAVLEKWAKIRGNPRELSSKPVGIAWPAPPADNTADMSGK